MANGSASDLTSACSPMPLRERNWRQNWLCNVLKRKGEQLLTRVQSIELRTLHLLPWIPIPHAL